MTVFSSTLFATIGISILPLPNFSVYYFLFTIQIKFDAKEKNVYYLNDVNNAKIQLIVMVSIQIDERVVGYTE